MKTEKRWELIAQSLQKSGSLSTKELANALSVSEATIRRDLIQMENNNMISRLWGGASLPAENNKTAQYQDEYILRFGRNTDVKRRLAQYAASLVKEGDSIFIDAGSTTSYIAEYLDTPNINVVTNNLNIFKALAERQINTYLPHGKVLYASCAIMGPDTAEWILQKNFDLVFLGNSGLDATVGYSTRDENDAQIKRCALSRCAVNGAYILSDSSKTGRRCFHTFSKLNEATLITDEEPPFQVEKIVIV